jgi:alpha-tubulin suppressor-like RCC1 family protein/subtilisin-like proprotein convertase family protein
LDPSISAISPDFGDYTGSTEVTITGDYLIDGLTTALGSNTLSSVTVVDAKTIQATVQSVPRGVHTVTVSNPNGASSSIVNAFESTLTDITTVGSTFVSGSPLQNTITFTEDVRMSDLYVHINVSHPIVPAELNLTLETPTGQMISLFDGIQVANEEFQWKSGFDSIFGFDEAPSEALYQLKGESSLGSWTLHASSSSSSTNTLHSWGVTFLEYRHRDHADQVYCAAEYRNHVMSFDSVNGDLLFRSKFVGSYDYDVAVSHDGRYLYSPGGSYHDGNSWENSILNVYDAWTGKIINTYQLAGRASPNSLAPVPNGNLIVVTSTQLYLIDISGQSIDANISLTYNSNWETYAVAVNPQGTIVYVTNKDENLLQTYSLPTLAHLGNMSTGTYSPFDVDISSDGSFGVIGYEEDFIAEFHTSNLSIYSNHSVGTGRASITLNHDDSEVYAGWFQTGAGFSHLDLQTGTSTQYSDGYGGTNGVYILGDRVYISEWSGNRIIVWDPSSMSEVTTIDLTPVDGYRCRGITAAEPPGLLTPNISASSNSLTLSWSAPSSGPAVTEYRVYKGDSPGNESYYATVSPSTLTYTDTSASSTALSYYRVSAVMAGIGEGPVSSRLIGAPGSDFDGDGIADALDDDDDNDGVLDSDDAFPLDPNEDTDTDGDGTGNNADTDDDGDGVDDSSDAFPLDPNEDTDTDGDGTGNNADTDDDGDGVADSSDAFPLDSSEDTDTDGDGTGNNADIDDDGDGWSDDDEAICSTNPIDSNSVPSDTDSDGICDEVDSDRAEAGFQAGSVFTYSTLSAMGSSTCAVLDNGSLQCWGLNTVGKLGDGTTTSRTTPTAAILGSGRTAVATAMGFYTSCSILDDGSVKCWGQNNGGSSGNTVSIGADRAAVAIAVGFDHACAILDNASLICWGGNSAGQLGDGTTTSSSTVSVDLGAGRTAAAIGTGSSHTCAILDNASLKCWGSNSHGQLGDGTTTDSSSPVSVDVGAGRFAIAISGGRYHTCAILDDGSVKCWGYNGYGGLGDGTYTDSSTPSSSVDLGTGLTAVSIATGYYHSCAILSDASLKCWGRNYDGQLGDGTTTSSSSPVSITLDTGRSVLAVAAGSGHTCTILDNMSVQCWGSNSAGQLGDGTTIDSTTPTYVSLASGSKVAVSERDLDSDGVLNILDTHMAGDDDGDGVVDTNDDYLNNPARWISCSSGSYGRFTCTDSIAGHYVPNAGSLLHTSQLECSIGTYQPSTGQSSCTDASSGYYVDSTAATSQTACLAGTYNSNTGSTSSSDCTDADAGYYTSSAGSAFQTACAAGTYQSSTGQTSCTDADAGYYVSITGSPSQTACAAGTYQPSMGQSSCLDASTGYYVPTTAATSQTACAAGTYQPSTGQSSCTDASAGYYVFLSAATAQAACAAGTYQPFTGQTSCIDASAGYYVDSTAATSQTACAAGTYNPNTASTSSSACLDADAGYYTSNAGSVSQTACATGTYQPSTAQTLCIDADAGYYVPSTASTSQTACAAGTYQPSTGQPSCIDASAGYYVDTTAATSQTACAAGTYQPSTGQASCLDASPGYYVGTTASPTQTACGLGTYQPNSGQISCIDASPGNYVNTIASTNQTACDLGTYQPNSGQSFCLDAPAGTYVDTMGATSPTDCSIGSYQNQTGQTSCIDADAGYHVPNTGSTNQTICPPGTYQPSTGQASCIDASVGYYVPNSGALVQTPCALGTYQPLSGQPSCIDSDAGYYVDISGSALQFACNLGTYQDLQGQVSCIVAPVGYYVNTTAATNPTACDLGTYQPNTGQTGCIIATSGHYVDSNGSSTQTPCLAGTYNPQNGSITQSDCVEADTGHYVPNEGLATQSECNPGSYQNITGQADCNFADVGYYVPSSASWFQVGCTAGFYQPNQGQISCVPASIGYYVPSHASPSQFECELGSYQNAIGQTSCTLASIGHYVNSTAATNQTECPPGNSTPTTGSDSIFDCYIDNDGDTVPDIIDMDDDNDGYFDDIDDFPLDNAEWLDTDGDGIGNNADLDDDDDGWDDATEIACGNSDPLNSTSVPLDYDADGICDTQDSDDDNDLVADVDDAFPLDECAYLDTDNDGYTDWIVMNCSTNLIEDDDDDNDGYNDSNDTFPLDSTEWIDTDMDGIGNNADTDDDGDTVPDEVDEFPLDSSEWLDDDGDGIGDNSDTDNDNDGTLDVDDDFPFDAGADIDTDNDGLPDTLVAYYSGTLVEDLDDDGDGVLDINDDFPLDSTEWTDTDGDGIGNNTDSDDDGDGWSDSDEYICGTSPIDATDVPADSDGDGICDSEDDDSAGLGLIIAIVKKQSTFIFLGVVAIIIGILFVQVSRKNRVDEEVEFTSVEDLFED